MEGKKVCTIFISIVHTTMLYNAVMVLREPNLDCWCFEECARVKEREAFVDGDIVSMFTQYVRDVS